MHAGSEKGREGDHHAELDGELLTRPLFSSSLSFSCGGGRLGAKTGSGQARAGQPDLLRGLGRAARRTSAARLSKHCEIRFFRILQGIDTQEIVMHWVDTEREVADVMKPLRRVKHKRGGGGGARRRRARLPGRDWPAGRGRHLGTSPADSVPADHIPRSPRRPAAAPRPSPSLPSLSWSLTRPNTMRSREPEHNVSAAD